MKKILIPVIFCFITTLTKSQNVGIGTNNPKSKLHVSGGTPVSISSRGTITLENDDNAFFQFIAPDDKRSGFYFGRPGNTFDASKANILYNTVDNAGGFDFQASEQNIPLRLSKQGKLGINTFLPKSQLHISNGNTGINPHFLANITTESLDDNYFQFLTASSREAGFLFGNTNGVAQGGIVYNNPGNPEGLDFRTNGNIVRMVIDDAGYIGLGTTTPTAKLDVNGAMRLRGNGASAGALLRSVDNLGNTNWMKPAAFRANGLSGNANQVIPANLWTKVAFGSSAEYNEGLYYQPWASQFVAPVNGIYHFEVQLKKGLAYDHYLRIEIKRGNSYIEIARTNPGNSDTYLNISGDTKLQAGDEVFVSFLTVGVQVTFLASQTENWFFGRLVTQL